MRINHNIAALNAYRNMSINNENTSKSLEKLSSGLRINRAADDAAGLAISEKMRSQIRGLDMAERNAMDGISVVQTADGALNSTTEILQRMRELAVQSASDSNTDTDRQNIQKEIDQLTTEVNRIGNSTEFNTKSLLNGSLSSLWEDKQISSATGSLGSAVSINPQSLLPDGSYSVSITKTTGTPYNSIDTGTIKDTSGSSAGFYVTAVDNSNNSALPLSEGGYQVIVSGADAALADSNGKLVGNWVALSGSSDSIDLGNNIKLTYDHKNLGTPSGTILTFSVGKNTPVTYKMSLNQDTDGDGVFETSVDSKTFNLGDPVSFTGEGNGVQVQTTSNTSDGNNLATFKVEGGAGESAKLQIGANSGQTVSLEINDMRAKALLLSTDVSSLNDDGSTTIKMSNGKTQKVWYNTDATVNDGSSENNTQHSLDVSSNEKAQAAIAVLDDAVNRVSSERARLGAIQNRLEYTVDNLKTMGENVTSSESRIRDVDMAEEMTNFTKNNILNQAAQAMLSQANQLPQGVLQLLK